MTRTQLRPCLADSLLQAWCDLQPGDPGLQADLHAPFMAQRLVTRLLVVKQQACAPRMCADGFSKRELQRPGPHSVVRMV